MVASTDIIALAVLAILVATEALPTKAKKIVFGLVLLGVGAVPLLNLFKVISIDVYSYPIIGFIAIFAVFEVGDVLVVSGFKEDSGGLKIPLIITGVIVIIITLIPWMHEYNALSFGLPKYSEVVNIVIYLAAGVLVIISGAKGND